NDLVNGPGPNEVVLVHAHRKEPIRLDRSVSDLQVELWLGLLVTVDKTDHDKHGKNRSFHVLPPSLGPVRVGRGWLISCEIGQNGTKTRRRPVGAPQRVASGAGLEAGRRSGR